MDESRVKELLEEVIEDSGGLHQLSDYINWRVGDEEVVLDGEFTPDMLEAIAWWMRYVGFRRNRPSGVPYEVEDDAT